MSTPIWAKTKFKIEAGVSDFIDKTKADLKTDLPRMYQASADLVHISLQERMALLQTDLVSKVNKTLTDVMQSSSQSATAEINTHVEALKEEVRTDESRRRKSPRKRKHTMES